MTRDERDRLAAEHVLGLLEGAEATEAEELLRHDRAFQQAVAQWRDRFLEFDDQAPVITSGEALWHRIEADLDRPTQAASQSLPAPLIRSRATFTELWRSLAFWRVTGLAGAFASLLLAVGLAVGVSRAPPTPIYVAVLLTNDSRPAAILNAFADGQAELVPLEGVTIPPDRSLELWSFAHGATAPPVSIGVLNQARAIRLRLDQVPQIAADQLFAVSLEPSGGSPTGQPTGPVLMKGTATSAL
ncbi:anti-sigma factor domain-containing protein [Microvirga sp. VF16]|uniref:anti-sigma factor n=1 Tax=Microvirga sp. VF16 TaxID=2807101 RepID=UPI00193D7635|nr:anti-sigma factor [Microvirga sp. VF16]QRM35365.1 anti-sigma factor [Microvirga sp. VF16]